MFESEENILDPEQRSSEVLDFEQRLNSKIVGQCQAVNRVVNAFQIYMAGMAMPGRPIGNLLFLGPTGSGKTRVVEAAADILFGSPRAFMKVDCAEFQHSHEIAKLIGSPPGYLGHRETPPLFTQEAIDQYQTDRVKMGFILFDEIEKANDALWQLLLAILDKASLTLGDNRKVDLSRTVIFMTSNLGAIEMVKLMEGGIGFTSGRERSAEEYAELQQKMYNTAIEVAKHRFSPEFMNRIDKTIVFRTLTPEDLRQVLDIELNDVQNRIMSSQRDKQFIFRCTSEAKELLLREGTDLKYGARHLKRAIERYLVFPMANLIATGQIGLGDVIKVDSQASAVNLIFFKERAITSFASAGSEQAMTAAAGMSEAGIRRAGEAGSKVVTRESEHDQGLVECLQCGTKRQYSKTWVRQPRSGTRSYFCDKKCFNVYIADGYDPGYAVYDLSCVDCLHCEKPLVTRKAVYRTPRTGTRNYFCDDECAEIYEEGRSDL